MNLEGKQEYLIFKILFNIVTCMSLNGLIMYFT